MKSFLSILISSLKIFFFFSLKILKLADSKLKKQMPGICGSGGPGREGEWHSLNLQPRSALCSSS